jgi:hypothetical protein
LKKTDIAPAQRLQIGLNCGWKLKLLPIVLLQACSTVTTTLPDGSHKTQSIEEFEQYAESVFRRQNQATAQAGMLLDEDLNPGDYNAMEAAESDMLRACKALNEIANRQIDQQDSNILLELEVKQTIGECDYATQNVEQLFELLQ